MSTPLLRIVVTDANVLINLMHVSRLGLLAQIPNYEFVVPDHVREEVTLPEQRTTLDDHVREEVTLPEQRTTLDAAVTAGGLKLEVIDDLGAITVFTELIAHIGRGEAACIAIAAQKGWLIASDEKKRFLCEAVARVGVGHVITTVDVFVLAINAGLLTVEEADADKVTLEGRRFKVSFASFRELVKYPTRGRSSPHGNGNGS